MKRVTLLRTSTGDQGTFGLLMSEGFSVYIGELPWRDNVKTKSCIPEGVYVCKWHKSPRFGFCYKVFGVVGRSEILFHAGNYSGNIDIGYKSHSHGCILLGLRMGILDGQKALLQSFPARKKLEAHFNKESFILEIKNARDYIGIVQQ